MTVFTKVKFSFKSPIKWAKCHTQHIQIFLIAQFSCSYLSRLKSNLSRSHLVLSSNFTSDAAVTMKDSTSDNTTGTDNAAWPSGFKSVLEKYPEMK